MSKSLARAILKNGNWPSSDAPGTLIAGLREAKRLEYCLSWVMASAAKKFHDCKACILANELELLMNCTELNEIDIDMEAWGWIVKSLSKTDFVGAKHIVMLLSAAAATNQEIYDDFVDVFVGFELVHLEALLDDIDLNLSLMVWATKMSCRVDSKRARHKKIKYFGIEFVKTALSRHPNVNLDWECYYQLYESIAARYGIEQVLSVAQMHTIHNPTLLHGIRHLSGGRILALPHVHEIDMNELFQLYKQLPGRQWLVDSAGDLEGILSHRRAVLDCVQQRIHVKGIVQEIGMYLFNQFT